jgi:hypothetical protein
METTSVMAALNALALANVDLSKHPQTRKQIQIKGSTKLVIYLITLPW